MVLSNTFFGSLHGFIADIHSLVMFVDMQMHELAMKLALQKSHNAELRTQFEN